MRQPDYERAEAALKRYEKILRGEEQVKNSTMSEYSLMSVFLQSVFIGVEDEDEQATVSGSFKNANLTLLSDILNKVKKHPVFWRKFFMV